MEVAPIFAVKYRTTTPGISMEIYTDSVNNSVSSNNIVRIPIESDGEWHVEYVNLSAIRQFNGATVNYFRFDIMNAPKLPVDAYIEFEYFGFFNSDEEVEMFETGKHVPVIYVDPNSGYIDATKDDIVHASSIDMINGMGGAGSPTFNYRGGNSAAGVDSSIIMERPSAAVSLSSRDGPWLKAVSKNSSGLLTDLTGMMPLCTR